MAANLVTVTGNIETLTGAPPLLGRLWFKLNRPDWNLTGNIFAPEYIEAVASTVNGAFSVDLQTTDDLEAGASYSVILKYREPIDGKDREYIVASFMLPDGGPYQLGDLLTVPFVEPVPADILALCQAYAVSAAASAASAAQLLTVFRTIESFGDENTGDGIGDDLAAVLAALNYGGMIVGRGTYLLSATVNATPARDLTLDLAGGGRIKAAVGFAANTKLVTIAPSAAAHVTVRNGYFDGRDMPVRTAGAADLLYMSSQNFRSVRVENSTFNCNDLGSVAGRGDSCLFIAECENVWVNKNKFIGAPDAGVYLSGDQSASEGKFAIITDNEFEECGVAIISKRNFQHHVVQGNLISDCETGIAIGGEGETTTGPSANDVGRYGLINGNYLVGCGRGIEARISNEMAITGNVIRDHGQGINDAGIVIAGSDNCQITGNVISAGSVGASTAGIRIMDRVMNAVTYTSDGTSISGNTIIGFPLGVVEIDASNGTIIGANAFAGVANPITLIGALSRFGVVIPEDIVYEIGGAGTKSLEVRLAALGVNGVRVTGAAAGSTPVISGEGSDTDINLCINPKGVGVLLLGGGAGNESLRVKKGVTAGNAVEVEGVAAGSSPTVRARGADTNVDLILSGKGTGNVRFGTNTANADAPVVGYITIKDAGGTLRKLAVIA